MFASIFKWRAEELWAGLAKLLQSEAARNALYDHPLIKGLSITRALGEPVSPTGRNGPSYIPSKTFALALIDAIRNPDRMAKDLLLQVDAFTGKFAMDPGGAVSGLQGAINAALSDAGLSEKRKADVQRLNRWFDAAHTSIPNLREHVDGILKELEDAPMLAPLREDLNGWITLMTGQHAPINGIRARAELQRIIDRVAPEGQGVRARQRLAEVAATIANSTPDDLANEVKAFSQSMLQAAMSEVRGDLGRTLGTLLTGAAHDADRFRENIEIWFNDGMDRVAGSYKRKTMKWQFGIAAALAIMLNVDALLMVRALWREPTLRKSLANQGAAMVETPPASLARLATTASSAANDQKLDVSLSGATVQANQPATAYVQVTAQSAAAAVKVNVNVESAHLKVAVTAGKPGDRSVSFEIPADKAGTKVPVFISADAVKSDSLERLRFSIDGGPTTPIEIIAAPSADQRFENLQAQLEGLGLPMGWSCGTTTADTGTNGGASSRTTTRTLPFWCGGGALGHQVEGTGAKARIKQGGYMLADVLALLLGWLITAAAASLGAPFWFDMLKRVVAVRSAGKAPEERPLSPKEVPQPREPGQRAVEADLLKALSS
jgi:hypothetical protein